MEMLIQNSAYSLCFVVVYLCLSDLLYTLLEMGKKRGAVQLGNSRDFLAVSVVVTVIILIYEVLSLTPAGTGLG